VACVLRCVARLGACCGRDCEELAVSHLAGFARAFALTVESPTSQRLQPVRDSHAPRAWRSRVSRRSLPEVDTDRRWAYLGALWRPQCRSGAPSWHGQSARQGPGRTVLPSTWTFPSPPSSRWGRPDRPHSRRKPRSYQVTLDGLGRRRRHNAGRSAQADIRNVSQPPPPESATAIGRRHAAEHDSEFHRRPSDRRRSGETRLCHTAGHWRGETTIAQSR
jgi:hypothetical protein